MESTLSLLAVAAMALFAVLVQGGLAVWEGLVLLAALAGALTAVIRKGGGDALGTPPRIEQWPGNPPPSGAGPDHELAVGDSLVQGGEHAQFTLGHGRGLRAGGGSRRRRAPLHDHAHPTQTDGLVTSASDGLQGPIDKHAQWA